MKAALYHSYGPPEVVKIENVPTPKPKGNEVLIKIEASTVSSGDARARSLSVPKGFSLIAGAIFGFSSPRKRILGTEFSGTIVEVGREVTKFKVGDNVFGFPGIKMGCHAEFRVMSEEGRILTMPKNLDFNQAAALSFGATTALYFLRDLGKLQAGETALIIGASGAVGSAAVQIANYYGGKVTGVTSTKNVGLVHSLGCDQVIDYSVQDFLKINKRYDVILDTVGVNGFSNYRHLLTSNGRLLLAAGDLPQILEGAWVFIRNKGKVLSGGAKERVEDLKTLKNLAESGHFKPLIDRAFPLNEIVNAYHYVDSGRKKGSVIITMT